MSVTRVFHKVTSLGSPPSSPPSSLPPSLPSFLVSFLLHFSHFLHIFVSLLLIAVCILILRHYLSPQIYRYVFPLAPLSYLRFCPRLGGSRVGTMTLPLHAVVCTRPAPSLTPSLLFIPSFSSPSIYRFSVHPSRDDLLLTAMPLKVIRGINELRSQACVGV